MAQFLFRGFSKSVTTDVCPQNEANSITHITHHTLHITHTERFHKKR